jgi:benzoate-CoA ligase family protein
MSVPPTFNLASRLLDDHVAAGRGGAVAVWYRGRELTYRDLKELTDRAGGALRGLGVRVEERVLLALPDGPELLAALLGALKLGAVPVPVAPSPGQADHELLARDARAAAALVGPEALAPLAGVPPDRLPHLRHLLAVGAAGLPDDPRVHAFETLAAAAPPALAAESTSRDDVAFWLYSSGTTGAPKAVLHVHQAAVHACEGYAVGVLGLGPGDRTYSVARLASAAGLGNSCFFPFWVGGSTALEPQPPSAERVLAVLAEARPTLLFARPATYQELLAGEAPPVVNALRLAACSGDRLPEGLYERFRERFGVEVLEGTGSTETLHMYLSNRPGRAQPGSSGEPVPGYDARLAGEDGGPVAPGEIGDLHVRAGSVFAGYWHDLEQTRRALLGEWLVTGDKYRQDAEGRYWYVGRSAELWRRGGRWVVPAEVEAVLTAHPAVVEAGVVGVDEAGERVPLACVVVRQGASARPDLAAELRALAADRLGAAMAPGPVVFAERLPKTASGKLQRFRLPELRQG